MSDNRVLILFIVSVLVLVFAIFQGSDAGAMTLEKITISLDQPTLQKGFTVKSSDDLFWLPIFPGQFDRDLQVTIQKTDNQTVLPYDFQAISDYYIYDIKTGQSGFLPNPIVLSLKFDSDTNNEKVVFYYDNNKKNWQRLTVKIDKKNKLIKARTIFPYAKIVVAEKKSLDSKFVMAVNQQNGLSAIVIDQQGRVIFEQNADQIRPLASLSKLMTAMVFYEHNPGWNEFVTIIESDNIGGAGLPLKPGDIISVKDLFYATLVGSKNNAARALMRSTGLSEEEFVRQMNEKAVMLDCLNTHFVEPTGLSEQNVSTASDMAQIARQAFDNFAFLQATTTKEYSVKIIRDDHLYHQLVRNTNELLNENLYITGGKTGYTPKAGYNLVTQAKNKVQELIALVMGATKGENFTKVYSLLKQYL